MRRIKRDSDNCRGDDQDDDKDDHYQEDGWIKEGMPELQLCYQKGLMNNNTMHKYMTRLP